MTKIVLVTGATGNLGSVVCQVLGDAGYTVYGAGLPGSRHQPPGVSMYEADLSEENAAEKLIADLRQKEAKLNGLVCLAGGFGMHSIRDLHTDDLMGMFRLNLLPAVHIIRAVWDWMSASGGGRIILTGAKPALEGHAFDMLPYALSKGSVIQLAQILNEKSNQTGIRTSVIVPSIIDTPPNRSAMPDANPDDWVKPTSIASHIRYLLDDSSDDLRETVLKIYGNS